MHIINVSFYDLLEIKNRIFLFRKIDPIFSQQIFSLLIVLFALHIFNSKKTKCFCAACYQQRLFLKNFNN